MTSPNIVAAALTGAIGDAAFDGMALRKAPSAQAVVVAHVAPGAALFVKVRTFTSGPRVQQLPPMSGDRAMLCPRLCPTR